ncbi:MAG: LysM peptidoglycan-binding domain-containing protein, partial [Bacteroidaceae bacterium]|nr:LysM peptidoglycan-binding domain-containing protein [Bacteroidaceae bacterium]
SSSSRTTAASGSTPTYHKIRSGETLSTIAARYGTTVAKLRSLNGISGSRITAGKNLRVK